MTMFVLMLLVLAVLAVLVGAASFSWLVVRFAARLPVRDVDAVRDRVDELREDIDELRADVDSHHGEMRNQNERDGAAYQHLINQVYQAEERVKVLEGRLRGTIGKLAGTGIIDLTEETR